VELPPVAPLSKRDTIIGGVWGTQASSKIDPQRAGVPSTFFVALFAGQFCINETEWPTVLLISIQGLKPAEVEQNTAPMNRESRDQAWQCVSPAGPVG